MNLDPHLPQTTSARLDNFSAIVERHQDLVWAIAFAATGDAATSDDVAQETFLAAWKQQADIRELAKMRGYLASIARNLAYRSMRGAGREIPDGGDSGDTTATEGPSPLERMLSDEKMTQVECGLREMPRASREPFVLFYLEGSSLSRVAADLDLSESAVKQRLYRARESLKSSVASQLAAEVARCRPALGAAVYALIVSQITEASAATASVAATSGAAIEVVHASTGLPAQVQPAALTPEAQLLTTNSSKAAVTTGLLGGGAIAFAGKAGAALSAVLLAAILYSLSGEAGASAPVVQIELQDHADEAAPFSPSPSTTTSPALEVITQEEAPRVEGLSDQPLITGRLRINHPGVDANEDGHISEDEVEEVRRVQGELLLSLIEKHFEDAAMHVRCTTVGLDAEGAYEGVETYEIEELREQHAQDIAGGLDLSLPEWIASQVAAQAREGRVCYKTKVRFDDDIRQLKVEFEGEPIRWALHSKTMEGEKFFLSEPPKELLRELSKVEDTEMAQAFADRWGVFMSAYKNDAYYSGGASGYSDPETMHRHPAIVLLAAEHEEKQKQAQELAASEGAAETQEESL